MMHTQMAATFDQVLERIHAIQHAARAERSEDRPRWPAIVLVSPKGWTGPKVVDGKQVEGTFRAHQVPVTGFEKHPDHLQILDSWMRSYRPEELFDENGSPVAELLTLPPEGDQRMSGNPHANGGLLLHDLNLPDFQSYAVDIGKCGSMDCESTRPLGEMLRDILSLNGNERNFRVFGPDETASNRLDAVFEVTNRTSEAQILPSDDHVARDGRVMEVLSEHLCQGWLEGYLLTGRHGIFSRYEAFIHIIDSMCSTRLREMAEGHAAHSVASADRVVELPADLARLASGP